jgi:exopolysaccharide production protein ExoZ
LNYEAVFYVIFTAALLAPAAWRLAIVVMSLLTIALFGLFDPPTYELGANPMLLQFAAGAVIGKLAVERMLPTRAWAGVLLVAGVAAFAVMEVFNLRSDLWRPFLWGLPALAIVTGAVSLEARGPVPVWPWLRSLGDASYAIYLCHLPATALVAHTLGTGSVWLFLPASIIVSTAAGLACCHGLEKPLLAALRSLGRPRAAARAAPARAV